MQLNQSRQLRQLTLCLAAAFLTTQASAAVNYQFRLAAKGVVSPLTDPAIGEVSDWTVVFGTAAFQIPAPASNSTGAFSYSSSAPNVATVTGNKVTPVGVGTTTITAAQAADSRHNPGTLAISLTVLGAAPALAGFSNITTTYGAGSFTLTPPSSASTGPIAYASDNPAVASVSGSTVNLLAAGVVTITATQAAAGNYAAEATSATLTVSKAVPVIQAWTVPAKKTVDDPFNLAAPSSTSPAGFSYTSSNIAVATISGSTVSIIGQGVSTITATQAAGLNFTAGSKSATLTVSLPPLPSGYFTYAGLTWTPRSTQSYAYPSALNYCSGTFNGTTGWRLPTLAEFVPTRNADLLTGVNINTWNQINNGNYIYSQTAVGTGSGYVAPVGDYTFQVYCVK